MRLYHPSGEQHWGRDCFCRRDSRLHGMSGRRSRDKGARREREFVELHRVLGVEANRVPLSGAAEGFKGDIHLTLRGRALQAEVKARANGSGFTTLEKWLGDNDALFLRRDRADAMVVLPWRTWAWLVEEPNGETTQP